MKCIRCSSKIKENGQFYIAGDMGPEIIALLEQSLGPLVNFYLPNHTIATYGSSFTKLLPTEPPESDDDTLSVASSIPSISIKSEMDSDISDDVSEEAATIRTMAEKSVASSQRVEVESLLNVKKCHLACNEAEKRHIKIIVPRQQETEKRKPVSPATVSTVPVRSVASSQLVGVKSLLNGKLCHSASKEVEKRHIKIIAPRQQETEKLIPVSPATVSTVPVRSVASSQIVGVKSLLNGKLCHSASKEVEKRHIKIIAPRQIESENPKPGSSDTMKPPKRKPRIPYPPDFLSSPMRKMPTSHSLTSNEKYIALNIYKYIHKMTTTYPYKMDILAQVAQIMGTSTSTISRVLLEFKSKGKVSSPPPRKPRPRVTLFEKLDANEIEKIKRIVRQLEVTNEVSVEKVLTALKKDADLPKFSRTTFYGVLKKLNIKLSKSRNRKDVE